MFKSKSGLVYTQYGERERAVPMSISAARICCPYFHIMIAVALVATRDIMQASSPEQRTSITV